MMVVVVVMVLLRIALVNPRPSKVVI